MNEWIPCSERFPKEEGDYLVQTDLYGSYNMEVVHFDSYGYFNAQHGYVVAWMPLLTPYEPSEAECLEARRRANI